MAETAQLLKGASIHISRHKLDVADRAATAALPQAVMAEHGRVDLLFNNAGVALAGTFEQISEIDFDWLWSAPESLLCHIFRPRRDQRGAAGYVERYPSLNLPFGIIYGKSDRLLDYRRHGESLRRAHPPHRDAPGGRFARYARRRTPPACAQLIRHPNRRRAIK